MDRGWIPLDKGGQLDGMASNFVSQPTFAKAKEAIKKLLLLLPPHIGRETKGLLFG
jgi:hypothetical protein